VARRPTTVASHSPRDSCTSCHTIFDSDEQMFGAKQQVPHGGQSYQ
jgi:hypothetical protein